MSADANPPMTPGSPGVPLGPTWQTTLWNFFMASFFLVCSFLATGLTIGLTSCDSIQIKIMKKCGNEESKAIADKLAILIKDRQFLLITLLCFNSTANECLPIYINKLLPGFQAVMVSVFLCLIFGEVIPATLFTGANKYKLAASLAPLVNFLFCFYYPLSIIIWNVLVRVFGKSSDLFFNRTELQTYVEEMTPPDHGHGSHAHGHSEHANEDHHDLRKIPDEQDVSPDEVVILKGVMDSAIKIVGDKEVMVPIENVKKLNSTDVIDSKTRQELQIAGHSRIPIIQPNQSIKYIQLKDFTVVADEELAVGQQPSAFLKEPIKVQKDMKLLALLKEFCRGKSHLAVIYEGLRVIGIVTLEDILEKILNKPIFDEKDTKDEKDKKLRKVVQRQNDIQHEFSEKIKDQKMFNQTQKVKKNSQFTDQTLRQQDNYNNMNMTVVEDESILRTQNANRDIELQMQDQPSSMKDTLLHK